MLVRPTVICEGSPSGYVCRSRSSGGQEEEPMQVRTVLRGLVVTTVLAVLTALLPQLASAAPGKASGRYLVVARSAADLTALRAKAGEGGRQGRHIDAAG